jgi:phospholipase C
VIQAHSSSGRRRRREVGVALLVATCLAALLTAVEGQAAAGGSGLGAGKIRHVVILLQENHSFDDVFGRFCADVSIGQIVRAGLDMSCDGVMTGRTTSGTSIPLAPAPDYVPNISHTVSAQQRAIDGGAMDGFSRLNGCTKRDHFACYQSFVPSSIPNLSALAEAFALSDRTFELRSTPSWGGHLIFAAATTDGFSGDNPKKSTFTGQRGPGWGCDSYRDASWWNGSSYVLEPACVPNQSGAGPYRSSPVPYVPTIFDRLDAAGLSWRIYGAGTSGTVGEIPYGWDICPSFYECLGSTQRGNLVPTGDVLTDAGAGDLPNFSIVTPSLIASQHNRYSMAAGDNWIGSVVSAIEAGPEWSSTAVFVVYDDCGCFYDHVNPLTYDPSWGVRVPVVIVSPYAKAGYTDSSPATLASFLAFTERTYSLRPLGNADAVAYAFQNCFDYTQRPLRRVALTRSTIRPRERARIARERPPADEAS